MNQLSSKKNKKSKPSNWISGMGGVQRYMGLGIQAGMSVALYLVLGLLLDKWLDTLPWFTLIGAFVGVIAMFALFLRVNKSLNESSRQAEVEKEAKEQAGKPG